MSNSQTRARRIPGDGDAGDGGTAYPTGRADIGGGNPDVSGEARRLSKGAGSYGGAAYREGLDTPIFRARAMIPARGKIPRKYGRIYPAA